MLYLICVMFMASYTLTDGQSLLLQIRIHCLTKCAYLKLLLLNGPQCHTDVIKHYIVIITSCFFY